LNDRVETRINFLDAFDVGADDFFGRYLAGSNGSSNSGSRASQQLIHIMFCELSRMRRDVICELRQEHLTTNIGIDKSQG
jgi:hypothetical protein